MLRVIHQSQATSTYVLVESCSFPKEFLLPGKSYQLMCSFLTCLNMVVLFHSHHGLYHLFEGILFTSSSESFRAEFALRFIMPVAMWCYPQTGSGSISFLIERKMFRCVLWYWVHPELCWQILYNNAEPFLLKIQAQYMANVLQPVYMPDHTEPT